MLTRKIAVSQPRRTAGEPRGRGLRRPPGGDHGEDHHGQDRRQVQVVGQDPDPVGADELHDDGAGRVLDPLTPGAHRPGHSPAGCCRAPPEEGRRRLGQREAARHHRDHGEAEQQQRGDVVQQALALQDTSSRCGGEAGAGQRSRPRRRAGRRWRPASPPPPRTGPGPWRGRPGDRRGGEADGDEDQARHRRPVVPQVAGRGVVAGVDQDGRYEQGERQVGRDADGGREGRERQPAPATASRAG